MWSLFESESAKTTYSKYERLLLIWRASVNYSPAVPVFFVLSDPAKSTRCNFEKTIRSVDSTRDLDSI